MPNETIDIGESATDNGPERFRLAPAERCDFCDAEMRPMGQCKYVCLRCGFWRTCNDLF
jgi:hypothetical protein